MNTPSPYLTGDYPNTSTGSGYPASAQGPSVTVTKTFHDADPDGLRDAAKQLRAVATTVTGIASAAGTDVQTFTQQWKGAKYDFVGFWTAHFGDVPGAAGGDSSKQGLPTLAKNCNDLADYLDKCAGYMDQYTAAVARQRVVDDAAAAAVIIGIVAGVVTFGVAAAAMGAFDAIAAAAAAAAVDLIVAAIVTELPALTVAALSGALVATVTATLADLTGQLSGSLADGDDLAQAWRNVDWQSVADTAGTFAAVTDVLADAATTMNPPEGSPTGIEPEDPAMVPAEPATGPAGMVDPDLTVSAQPGALPDEPVVDPPLTETGITEPGLTEPDLTGPRPASPVIEPPAEPENGPGFSPTPLQSGPAQTQTGGSGVAVLDPPAEEAPAAGGTGSGTGSSALDQLTAQMGLSRYNPATDPGESGTGGLLNSVYRQPGPLAELPTPAPTGTADPPVPSTGLSGEFGAPPADLPGAAAAPALPGAPRLAPPGPPAEQAIPPMPRDLTVTASPTAGLTGAAPELSAPPDTLPELTPPAPVPATAAITPTATTPTGSGPVGAATPGSPAMAASSDVAAARARIVLPTAPDTPVPDTPVTDTPRVAAPTPAPPAEVPVIRTPEITLPARTGITLPVPDEMPKLPGDVPFRIPPEVVRGLPREIPGPFPGAAPFSIPPQVVPGLPREAPGPFPGAAPSRGLPPTAAPGAAPGSAPSRAPDGAPGQQPGSTPAPGTTVTDRPTTKDPQEPVPQVPFVLPPEFTPDSLHPRPTVPFVLPPEFTPDTLGRRPDVPFRIPPEIVPLPFSGAPAEPPPIPGLPPAPVAQGTGNGGPHPPDPEDYRSGYRGVPSQPHNTPQPQLPPPDEDISPSVPGPALPDTPQTPTAQPQPAPPPPESDDDIANYYQRGYGPRTHPAPSVPRTTSQPLPQAPSPTGGAAGGPTPVSPPPRPPAPGPQPAPPKQPGSTAASSLPLPQPTAGSGQIQLQVTAAQPTAPQASPAPAQQGSHPSQAVPAEVLAPVTAPSGHQGRAVRRLLRKVQRYQQTARQLNDVAAQLEQATDALNAARNPAPGAPAPSPRQQAAMAHRVERLRQRKDDLEEQLIRLGLSIDQRSTNLGLPDLVEPITDHAVDLWHLRRGAGQAQINAMAKVMAPWLPPWAVRYKRIPKFVRSLAALSDSHQLTESGWDIYQGRPATRRNTSDQTLFVRALKAATTPLIALSVRTDGRDGIGIAWDATTKTLYLLTSRTVSKITYEELTNAARVKFGSDLGHLPLYQRSLVGLGLDVETVANVQAGFGTRVELHVERTETTAIPLLSLTGQGRWIKGAVQRGRRSDVDAKQSEKFQGSVKIDLLTLVPAVEIAPFAGPVGPTGPLKLKLPVEAKLSVELSADVGELPGQDELVFEAKWSLEAVTMFRNGPTDWLDRLNLLRSLLGLPDIGAPETLSNVSISTERAVVFPITPSGIPGIPQLLRSAVTPFGYLDDKFRLHVPAGKLGALTRRLGSTPLFTPQPRPSTPAALPPPPTGAPHPVPGALTRPLTPGDAPRSRRAPAPAAPSTGTRPTPAVKPPPRGFITTLGPVHPNPTPGSRPPAAPPPSSRTGRGRTPSRVRPPHRRSAQQSSAPAAAPNGVDAALKSPAMARLRTRISDAIGTVETQITELIRERDGWQALATGTTDPALRAEADRWVADLDRSIAKAEADRDDLRTDLAAMTSADPATQWQAVTRQLPPAAGTPAPLRTTPLPPPPPPAGGPGNAAPGRLRTGPLGTGPSGPTAAAPQPEPPKPPAGADESAAPEDDPGEQRPGP